MLTSDHKEILRELALYTTFLAQALSSTAVPTFCELLFGCMLSGHGFVTQCLLAINDYGCVWSSYHHWVSQGKWRWRHLACRLIQLVCSKIPKDEVINLGLDDWMIERCSDKAPACRTHHQHSKKKNRPTYMWGQCWVSLAVIFERAMDEVFTAIPVISFPSPASGNTSKLHIAVVLLKVVRDEVKARSLRLLTDCWYMNWTLMQPVLEMGYEIIGQIPLNRALYALPLEPVSKKRGRPRKYGVKMTPSEVDKLSEYRATIWLYGKFRKIRYRTLICRARFLKGREVRVVWSQFENDKGVTERRLFIATNTVLEGIDVLRIYAKRWPVESMFQQMKHGFGCRQMWQQKLRTLLRWMHLKMAGYALLQLLTVCKNQASVKISSIPWRTQDTTTAGMLRFALSAILARFPIRMGWNRYSQKYTFNFNDLTGYSVKNKQKAA